MRTGCGRDADGMRTRCVPEGGCAHPKPTISASSGRGARGSTGPPCTRAPAEMPPRCRRDGARGTARGCDLAAISTRSRRDLDAISRLHELGVLDRYPRELLDPSLHGVNRRVAQAALTAAPRCRRRSRRLHTIAGERPPPPRAALRPCLQEGVGLRLAEQAVERDDPWRSAPHRRAGPRGEAFEHCVRRAGRRRGGRSRPASALRHALGATRDARPRT